MIKLRSQKQINSIYVLLIYHLCHPSYSIAKWNLPGLDMGYGLSDKMDFTWEVLHVYYISQLWYLWRILESYLKDLDTDRTFKCHTHNHRVLNWNLLSSWLNCPNLTMKYMSLLCMISFLCYGIVDSAISRKGGKKEEEERNKKHRDVLNCDELFSSTKQNWHRNRNSHYYMLTFDTAGCGEISRRDSRG